MKNLLSAHFDFGTSDIILNCLLKGFTHYRQAGRILQWPYSTYHFACTDTVLNFILYFISRVPACCASDPSHFCIWNANMCFWVLALSKGRCIVSATLQVPPSSIVATSLVVYFWRCGDVPTSRSPDLTCTSWQVSSSGWLTRAGSSHT